jgi:hypothetical protein
MQRPAVTADAVDAAAMASALPQIAAPAGTNAAVATEPGGVGSGGFSVTVASPAGDVAAHAELARRVPVIVAGREVGRLY